MSKYPKNYTDIEYYVKDRKKKIAGSTKAVRDFLAVVHENNPEFTIKQLRDLIMDESKYIPDYEAVGVLDAYISRGYGDHVPDWK